MGTLKLGLLGQSQLKIDLAIMSYRLTKIIIKIGPLERPDGLSKALKTFFNKNNFLTKLLQQGDTF